MKKKFKKLWKNIWEIPEAKLGQLHEKVSGMEGLVQEGLAHAMIPVLDTLFFYMEGQDYLTDEGKEFVWFFKDKYFVSGRYPPREEK